jgi:hypothetical protein
MNFFSNGLPLNCVWSWIINIFYSGDLPIEELIKQYNVGEEYDADEDYDVDEVHRDEYSEESSDEGSINKLTYNNAY